MSSKRAIRRRACQSKVRYQDKLSAVLAARALNKRGRRPWGTIAYKCDFCPSWHVGHPKRNKQPA